MATRLHQFELELSRNAISLSQEEREIDSIDNERLSQPTVSHDWQNGAKSTTRNGLLSVTDTY